MLILFNSIFIWDVGWAAFITCVSQAINGIVSLWIGVMGLSTQLLLKVTLFTFDGDYAPVLIFLLATTFFSGIGYGYYLWRDVTNFLRDSKLTSEAEMSHVKEVSEDIVLADFASGKAGSALYPP